MVVAPPARSLSVVIVYRLSCDVAKVYEYPYRVQCVVVGDSYHVVCGQSFGDPCAVGVPVDTEDVGECVPLNRLPGL